MELKIAKIKKYEKKKMIKFYNDKILVTKKIIYQ